MTAHRQKFETTCTILPLCRPPCAAMQDDARDHGKSFHVINQSRFTKQTMRAREGGFVAWFGAFVFKGLQQRGLFTANIAARAIKNLEGDAAEEPARLA